MKKTHSLNIFVYCNIVNCKLLLATISQVLINKLTRQTYHQNMIHSRNAYVILNYNNYQKTRTAIDKLNKIAEITPPG